MGLSSSASPANNLLSVSASSGASSPAMVSPRHHTHHFATKKRLFPPIFCSRLLMDYLLSFFDGTWKVPPHNTVTSVLVLRPSHIDLHAASLCRAFETTKKQLDIVVFCFWFISKGTSFSRLKQSPQNALWKAFQASLKRVEVISIFPFLLGNVFHQHRQFHSTVAERS